MFFLNTSLMDKNLISQLCVNRNLELNNCLDIITKKNENIIIYGARGIGKSFLMRLIEIQLRENYINYLPIYLNMTGLFSNSGNSSELTKYNIDEFPKLILLELCRTVWVDLFQQNYSDLRKDVLEENKIFEKKRYKKLKSIFNILVTEQRSFSNTNSSSIGLNLPVKSESFGEYRYGWTEKNVMNFEFFEYIEEFKKDILSTLGVEKIIVFCDESNHLPLVTQTELLSKYGELFSTRKVQILFLADESTGSKQYEEIAKRSFENIIHLNGFSNKDHILELINKYTDDKFEVTEDAIDILFESFSGHPRNSLSALEYAINIMTKSSKNIIDSKLMGLACINFIKANDSMVNL